MVFVAITLFVVCMVVMLLVKTKVSQEKRNYGIYKALGFTTRQLIVQMVCSNLPIMIAGAVIGAIASVYLTDRFVVVCLSFCGIKSCHMIINPLWQILTVTGITLVAIIVTVVFSMKIRKIEPAKMLMSE
jgi:ABC-type antimicrobial peptide transport system permease subunit